MTDKEKFILENYNITRDGKIFEGERQLNFRVNQDGYYDVRLKYNEQGKSQPFLVHRLVALKYLEKGENMPVTNHKDLNKTNNQVDNLEWSNVQLNTQHGYDNGAYPSIKRVKVIESDGTTHIFPSQSHTSRYYNYKNPSTIQQILDGKRKNPLSKGKRKGYYFEYTDEGVTTIERKANTVVGL